MSYIEVGFYWDFDVIIGFIYELNIKCGEIFCSIESWNIYYIVYFIFYLNKLKYWKLYY